MTQNNNIPKNNIFNIFPQYNFEQGNLHKASQEKKRTNNIAQIITTDDSIEINKDTKNKKRKKILFGSTITSAIFTAGVAGIIFAKGLHGSSLSKFSKYTENLTKRIQDQNINSKELPIRVFYYTQKGIKKVIDFLQASSNFTAIKDWLSNKAFKATKLTTKFAEKSTKFFKGVVDKTLGKKYDKVETKVKDLTSLLKHYNIDSLNSLSTIDKMQKINIKGKTLTLEEWINILSNQTQRLETTFDNSFSLGARRLRDNKRKMLLADLPEKIKGRFFKDKNSLFNLENYRTYATEDLTKEAQEELRREISKARKQVTNNITTIHDDIRSALSSFSQKVQPEDEISRKSIQTLKKQFEAFKKCSGINEAKDREKISKEISSLIDSLIKTTQKNQNYSPLEQEEMLKYLSSIKETVLSTGIGSKGALEEIMTILKGLNNTGLKTTGNKIIADSNFKEFSKLSSKISKNLEKATELESGEYFLKQAELKVGSAPTDVLSVLFPIGVGAYSIAKEDNKDEKISATLTTCIPLVGTFATFVYGTSKMLSGAKNLMFSFVSGVLLSKLGNYCDKLYKKYKDSGSVVNVVKDEYDNFWTGIAPQYAQPIKNNIKVK